MKILAVVGDFYHEEALYKKTLKEIIGNKKGVELSFTTREKVMDELKTYPDLIILASENRLDPEKDKEATWLTEEEAKEIENYVNKGGSWLAWHSGLAGYDDVLPYITMLGAYFTHHPEEHAQVTYTYRGHPLIKESEQSFQISDEHYFIKIVEPIDIFLESVSIDGESVAGWTRRVGEGRVAGYTPSHTKEGLNTDYLRKDMSQLIDWCGGDR